MTDKEIMQLWNKSLVPGIDKSIKSFARALLAASVPNPSDKQEDFVPCKCESDEGRICGRCHAWDDVKAAEQRRAIDRPLTDEQIELIGRMWATKRFNCDDIRTYLAAPLATPSDKQEAEFTKVVPHEPTKEMIEAGREQLDRMGFVKDVWQAMYCAAPLAQSAEQDRIDAEPTEAMLNAARDWSIKKYGQAIGSDAAIGCWKAMHAAKGASK